jgi:hypothetical protein
MVELLLELDFGGRNEMIGCIVKFHLNIPKPELKLGGKVDCASKVDASHNEVTSSISGSG